MYQSVVLIRGKPLREWPNRCWGDSHPLPSTGRRPAGTAGLPQQAGGRVHPGQPAKAERAILSLIDSAGDDIDAVLASRRRLPRVDAPARLLPDAGADKRPAVSRKSRRT